MRSPLSRVVTSLLTLFALTLSAPSQAAEAADAVYWGGPIHTADAANPKAEAVAVRGGRLVLVGSKADAQALLGPNTHVVDLRGAALYPGFTDAHMHLVGVGLRAQTLDLTGVPSLSALLDRVRDRVAATAGRPGAVVSGEGWIETAWPERRFPTRQDLDSVAPTTPVLLRRADGHALVANSAALAAAGITRSTPNPDGGEIVKDAAGEPTGFLIDAAMGLVRSLEVDPGPAERKEAYRLGARTYAARGWTGVHSVSVPLDDVPLQEALLAEGALPLRVYNAIAVTDGERLLAQGPRDAGDGRIVTRAIKLYADGALGSRGAALFDPYADAPTSGVVLLNRAQADGLYQEALRRGIQICTHAIGDRGNRLVLDAYAAAFAAVPPGERTVAEPRWRVEHAQVVHPDDIPRFASLGVIPSMQPSHAIGDLHFAPARLGPHRLKGAYAWQSLVRAGSRIAGGSDAPVEVGDPRIEFYAAVARRDLSGFAGPDWQPEEAVDRETALKMLTLWPAEAAFAEGELGSLRVGKRADLTVFDRDLMTVPPAEILTAKPLLTVIDGQVAFRAEGW